MITLKIKTMAEVVANGETVEYLFWVGCAGSFDERTQKITKALAKILQAANVSFAVLGTEETCTGDPAKRAGNEFLFQMQALQNITTLNNYGVKKIVTACPHCFNTLKNEYPQLGGHYEVIHHSQLIQKLIDDGKVTIQGGTFKGKKVVYHDPCYLGRANNIYEAPRAVIEKLETEMSEMKRSRSKGFCCGAGGAQIFKEAEKGTKEVNNERAEEALAHQPDIIAVACPFCNLMLNDGVKHYQQENKVQVKDIAQLIAEAADL
ncbi:MAG: (Fe-S)-binding protein [Bacteroidia bacterium]|nr:(Fe-S)-binding protein [Bacteroidia bacterium]